MWYDYKKGKQRVEAIFDGKMEVVEKDSLPSGDNFTFDNAYHSWIMAIFVDIRNSTELMSNKDQEYVAKVVRSFTSEVIEILRGDDRERELGIRGDCVYAIYTTPLKSDIYEVFDKAVWVNTYINMLNKILTRRNLGKIRAGIGVAVGNDHVIKAGRKDTGINSIVWMGDAVSKAAKLSSYGDKNGYSRIFLSSIAYSNLIDEYNERMPEKNPESWFHRCDSVMFGARYCNIVMTNMDEWVNNGMSD